jgi:hypothetical protein
MWLPCTTTGRKEHDIDPFDYLQKVHQRLPLLYCAGCRYS